MASIYDPRSGHRARFSSVYKVIGPNGHPVPGYSYYVPAGLKFPPCPFGGCYFEPESGPDVDDDPGAVACVA